MVRRSKPSPTIHASAVLVGPRAILIRGPAGAGKSRLVLNLLQTARRGASGWVRLVADDRVHLEAAHGRLIMRAPAAVAGLLEIRGIGMFRLPHEPLAVASLVVDLDSGDMQRMPEIPETQTIVEGVRLPRLAVAPGDDPFPMVVAALTLRWLSGADGGIDRPSQHDGQIFATSQS